MPDREPCEGVQHGSHARQPRTGLSRQTIYRIKDYPAKVLRLHRERQLEGIAEAKAAGVYKGRPASIDGARVRELKAQVMGASDIAKALKIGRASVYRALGEHR